jgi:hypothetical protein
MAGRRIACGVPLADRVAIGWSESSREPLIRPLSVSDAEWRPDSPGRVARIGRAAFELSATSQELVALGELADDLVGCVTPTSGHGAVLLVPSWGNRPAQHLDHYKGVTSCGHDIAGLLAERALRAAPDRPPADP